MKLAIKFNAYLVVILGVIGLGVYAGGREYLRAKAWEKVSQQARLMMDTTASVRSYTSEYVRPVLDKYQQHTAEFYPESVPAFSAHRMFTFLQHSYPEYSYREATLNPTNPADRAAGWEVDVVDGFRQNPAQRESTGEREAPNGRVLYLARPLTAVGSCLECHSTPEKAPPGMISLYGSKNGFGWNLGEIIGAQIVSVPVSVPRELAAQSMGALAGWLAGMALAAIVLLNAILYFNFIRPLRRVSAVAAELSKGNLNVPEIPAGGGDEISALADSLNRINRSLVKAIGLLGRQD